MARTNGESALAHAYAICVNPVPGIQRVTTSIRIASDDQTLDLFCPAGTQVHSVGGGIIGALGQSYLDEISPHGNLTGAHFNAREDVDGNPTNWSATLTAICAP